MPKGTSMLSDVCVQYEKTQNNGFLRYAPESRLLVINIFWLRDVGKKVGQRS